MADPARLDDEAVEGRLGRLDDVLGQLECIPGRTAELALEAIELLADVYGEALGRMCDRVSRDAGVRAALNQDELLRHLLVLHRLHPEPTEARVARALDDLRGHGVDAELVAVDGTTVHIGVSSRSCGSCGTTRALHERVHDEVLTAAPELVAVELVDRPAAPTLIPVAALSRRQEFA
jgi:hypothetical protein